MGNIQWLRSGFSTVCLLVFLIVSFSSPLQGQEVNGVLDFFKSNVGEWDATWKNWPTKDTTDPNVVRGVVEYSIFGNSWLISEAKFEIGYEEKWILGYDPKDLSVEGYRIGNIGPHATWQKGTYDNDTQTLSLSCECKVNSSDKKAKARKSKSKVELRMIDPDNQTHKIFAIDSESGKYYKSNEVVLVRRPKALQDNKLPNEKRGSNERGKVSGTVFENDQ